MEYLAMSTSRSSASVDEFHIILARKLVSRMLLVSWHTQNFLGIPTKKIIDATLCRTIMKACWRHSNMDYWDLWTFHAKQRFVLKIISYYISLLFVIYATNCIAFLLAFNSVVLVGSQYQSQFLVNICIIILVTLLKPSGK